MSDYFWLSDEQLSLLKPYFPKSHGVPRVDDEKAISGIIYVIKMACAGGMRRVFMGRIKRFIRSPAMSVFDKIFTSLSQASTPR